MGAGLLFRRIPDTQMDGIFQVLILRVAQLAYPRTRARSRTLRAYPD